MGEALGIDKEVLDRYSRRPPEESIVEMLDQWLRSSPPEKPTCKDVVKKISLPQLALDIEKVYETGSLTRHSIFYKVSQHLCLCGLSTYTQQCV